MSTSSQKCKYIKNFKYLGLVSDVGAVLKRHSGYFDKTWNFSYKMKQTICFSIALMSSFVCYTGAVPGTEPQTDVACKPKCGVNGSNLIACTILEFFAVFVSSFCKLLNSSVEITEFIACLSSLFISPFDAILQSILNGVIKGGTLTTSICPAVIRIWTSDAESMCPTILPTLNNILNI